MIYYPTAENSADLLTIGIISNQLRGIVVKKTDILITHQTSVAYQVAALSLLNTVA